MIFSESKIVHRYLDGLKGIELGPSKHNPFGIPGCIFVDQYQPTMEDAYGKAQFELCGDIQKIDVIAKADVLPFDDSTQDYVLSSHLLEHCWDPIFTIAEWKRVLVDEGLIVCIVPHHLRGLESDKSRPLTQLQEWIYRHEHPEWNPNEDNHHSVFSDSNLKDLFVYCGCNVLELLDPDDKVQNGVCIIVKC